MAIFNGVKVKKEVVEMVKVMVKEGFYRVSDEDKMDRLRELNEKISTLYEIKIPDVKLGNIPNSYNTQTLVINLESASIISYLHEYRHHLQNALGVRYKNMTIEQDARAWSLRVFSLACPKSFKKSVREGKVSHVKWDNELNKVIDDARYI